MNKALSSVYYRQSNFELLRILCMLGILIGHVLIALYQKQIHSADFSVMNLCQVLLLNASAVGMNCFVMISGFWGIHLSIVKILTYVGQCWWYAVCGMLLFGGSCLSLFFPITESGLWFVVAYLALMLICPLINAGLASMQGSAVRKVVIGLFVCDIYMGYMHQCTETSVDGYNLFHLVCMYCLGHLVAREDWKLERSGLWCIGCFVMMTALHAIKMVWFPISVFYSLHHNAPIMIVASLLVFIWAKGLNIKSQFINWIAASVFSVYLIHCNTVISPHFMGMLVYVKDYSDSPIITMLVLSFVIMVFFVGCILVDKVRISFFSWITSRLNKTISTL